MTKEEEQLRAAYARGDMTEDEAHEFGSYLVIEAMARQREQDLAAVLFDIDTPKGFEWILTVRARRCPRKLRWQLKHGHLEAWGVNRNGYSFQFPGPEDVISHMDEGIVPGWLNAISGLPSEDALIVVRRPPRKRSGGRPPHNWVFIHMLAHRIARFNRGGPLTASELADGVISELKAQNITRVPHKRTLQRQLKPIIEKLI